MSTTSDISDSEFRPSSTEAETSDQQEEKKETRLFWSDGHAIGEQYRELPIPNFNNIESGYLADDESDSEDGPRIEYRFRQPRSNGSSFTSSLLLSDSDGFEEKAVL